MRVGQKLKKKKNCSGAVQIERARLSEGGPCNSPDFTV